MKLGCGFLFKDVVSSFGNTLSAMDPDAYNCALVFSRLSAHLEIGWGERLLTSLIDCTAITAERRESYETVREAYRVEAEKKGLGKYLSQIGKPYPAE